MTPTSLVLACMALVLAVHAQAPSNQMESKVDEDGRQVQSMKMEAPSMTEEDQYGYTMPDQYRCDACKVVTHHLSKALKRTQSRRLKEWERDEIFEETCTANDFKGYGVSHVDGQTMLSGPSIKRDNIQPGMGSMQMGGETWEKRLGEICRKFVYEKVGEEEVYELFRSKGEVSSDICFEGTRDCEHVKLGPQPPPAKEATKAKKPKSEKKAKQAKAEVKADAEDKEIDVRSFISKLAKKQGFEKRDYTKKRTFAEWEELLVLMEAHSHASKRNVLDMEKYIEV